MHINLTLLKLGRALDSHHLHLFHLLSKQEQTKCTQEDLEDMEWERMDQTTDQKYLQQHKRKARNPLVIKDNSFEHEMNIKIIHFTHIKHP